MESKDVPQWVAQSFARSLANAGASASREELLLCCNELIRAWRAPGRFEHGLQHLIDMLSRVDILAPETPDPDLVRIAAWFHGIVFSTADLDVYTRNGGEDERASAQIAEEKLTALGLPADSIKTVKKLILSLKKRGLELGKNTKSSVGMQGVQTQKAASDNPVAGKAIVFSETDKFEAIDMNQHALCDAHLGVLAAEPQRYRKYALRIREEYEHIPLTHFLSARIKIVQRLLSRKKLYISPLASAWENTARKNLQVELEELITQLDQAREAQTTLVSAQTTNPLPDGLPGDNPEKAELDTKDRRSQNSGTPDADSITASGSGSASTQGRPGSIDGIAEAKCPSENAQTNIPAEFSGVKDASKASRVINGAEKTQSKDKGKNENFQNLPVSSALPESSAGSKTENKNHAQLVTQATQAEKLQNTANKESVSTDFPVAPLKAEEIEINISEIEPEPVNEPYIEKPASRTCEFSTVNSVNGATIVRKAPQTSLSSLEIFNDDFDPHHTVKSARTFQNTDENAQDQKQPDFAQKANLIKHSIETEPDF